MFKLKPFFPSPGFSLGGTTTAAASQPGGFKFGAPAGTPAPAFPGSTIGTTAAAATGATTAPTVGFATPIASSTGGGLGGGLLGGIKPTLTSSTTSTLGGLFNTQAQAKPTGKWSRLTMKNLTYGTDTRRQLYTGKIPACEIFMTFFHSK